MRISVVVKRLNPNTGKPFKCGDIREDGFVFLQYHTTRIKKNGFFREDWRSKESFDNSRKSCRDWYSNNTERHHQNTRNWITKNPEKRKKIARNWYEKNKDTVNKNAHNWKKLNPDKANAITAKRRSAKLKRTPNWLTEDQKAEMRDFYTIAKMFQMYTGETYHVDHIVPLQGKKVSGLNVPWNLQILPEILNKVKGNKHE